MEENKQRVISRDGQKKKSGKVKAEMQKERERERESREVRGGKLKDKSTSEWTACPLTQNVKIL